MSNETPIKLSKELVCEHLGHVTDKGAAWVLLQEPGFIGFEVVLRDDILFPRKKTRNSQDWGLVSDLRLFGEKGEWHVWRDWDGKHYDRRLEFKDVNDPLTEFHFLWGTDVRELPNKPPWIKLVEDRGAEIWLPLADSKLKKSDLPLRLKLKQIVDYDPKSHLAGIIDAALVELVRGSNKEPLLPTDLLPCS